MAKLFFDVFPSGIDFIYPNPGINLILLILIRDYSDQEFTTSYQ